MEAIKPTQKKTRDIRIDGDLAYIPLTRGFEATIDVIDVPIVDGKSWSYTPSGKTAYAKTKMLVDGCMKVVYLHRLLLLPRSLHVDHIDGDGLNNRRENLRIVTRSQNMQNQGLHKNNRSGSKGVSWRSSRKAWVAQISVNGVNRHLGYFKTIDAAREKYAKASIELHKEFGRVA